MHRSHGCAFIRSYLPDLELQPSRTIYKLLHSCKCTPLWLVILQSIGYTANTHNCKMTMHHMTHTGIIKMKFKSIMFDPFPDDGRCMLPKCWNNSFSIGQCLRKPLRCLIYVPRHSGLFKSIMQYTNRQPVGTSVLVHDVCIIMQQVLRFHGTNMNLQLVHFAPLAPPLTLEHFTCKLCRKHLDQPVVLSYSCMHILW